MPVARRRRSNGNTLSELQSSAIEAGVAQLEALIDQWEVGHQVARSSEWHEGPVRERRRANAIACNAPLRIAQDGVDVRAARRLDDAETDAVRSRWPNFRASWSVWRIGEQLIE